MAPVLSRSGGVARLDDRASAPLLRIAAEASVGGQALPARTYLHEPGIVMRVDALGRVVAQYGHVDVLFVGSSVVRCGIRPFDFNRAVGSSFGHPAVSFNAGLSGLWPSAVAFYLEHLWLPEAHPRIVVQGIRFGELYPSPRARKESAIFSPVRSRASGGHRRRRTASRRRWSSISGFCNTAGHFQLAARVPERTAW